MDSKNLIGTVQEKWELYKTRENITTKSDRRIFKAFYNGWLNGRIDLHFDDSELPVIIDATVKNIKVYKTNGTIYITKEV